jgi:hypothetical protein
LPGLFLDALAVLLLFGAHVPRERRRLWLSKFGPGLLLPHGLLGPPLCSLDGPHDQGDDSDHDPDTDQDKDDDGTLHEGLPTSF